MIVNATLELLRQRVEAEPTDWEARLIYADALDEVGEPILANGQRFQGIWQVRPHQAIGETWGWWFWLRQTSVERTSKLKQMLASPWRRPRFGNPTRAEAEHSLAMELHHRKIVAGIQ